MNKKEAMAFLRYRVIEPILDAPKGSVDSTVKEAASKKYFDPYFKRTFTFSERTLYRYLKEYKLFEFDGLKPKESKSKGRSKLLSPEEINYIVELKEGLVTRSAQKIIAMLELSGKVEKGKLKLRTVNRILNSLGYTRENLKKDNRVYIKNISTRIYEQYQGDTMEGVYINDLNGDTFKVYLFAFIDNYSKFVPHGQFYRESSLPRMEDCLKKAITKYGIMERIYVDNAKIFISDDFKLSCAKLGIKLSYATPYHPQGKGAIEKFWEFVQLDFLEELKLHPVHNIRELNERFFAWLDIKYHQKVHAAHGMTPKEAWDKQILEGIRPRFVSPLALEAAFLYTAERVVSKYGVVSFEANTYEIDASLVGKRVEVRYDPFNLKQLYIYYDDKYVCTAKPIDLQRERHSQYSSIKKDPECDPILDINYTELLAKQFRLSVQEQAKELFAGNHTVVNANNAIDEKIPPVKSDEEDSYLFKAPKDKEYSMGRKEFLNVISKFLNINTFSYSDKEMIYGFYENFKDFDPELFMGALSKLKNEHKDIEKNILYYLNTLKTELENILNIGRRNNAT